MAALILWTHVLAALAFAALALRSPAVRVPAALSALWAVAAAGLGAGEPGTALAALARDAGWIWIAWRLVRAARGRLGWGLAAAWTGAVAILPAAALLTLAAAGSDPRVAEVLLAAVPSARALSGAVLLVLLHDLAAGPGAERVPQSLCAGLAAMWGGTLMVAAGTYAAGPSPSLEAAEGLAAGAAAAVMLLGEGAKGRRFAVSRSAWLLLGGTGALAAYAALVVGAAAVADALGGAHARLIQTGVAAGAAVTLATLLSTSWLRAWTRVKLEQHLFGHRYDYRLAWARFTDALAGGSDEGLNEELAPRLARATAGLVDAPAGLLLTLEADGLLPLAGWRWDEAPVGPELALGRYLAESSRILELDAVRAGLAPAADAAAVPAWMLADACAWALVPLPHGDAVIGAVLLARPPVARPFDWEDLDLLRLAGRQAASFLAEDRAHAALAEARRFDEFHRRFAFLLHDVKNLASQVRLTARNAERHAENPAFRADMVETLRDAAMRMGVLLDRLSNHGPQPPVRSSVIDVGAVVRRVAERRRTVHPVAADMSQGAWALADADALFRLLDQLVGNAADASPAHEPVRIGVRAAGAGVVVEVADRGPGMTAAFVRDRLFRPFASAKAGGFGLGAFEARELARAMGATLSVDSRVGQGTTFRLALPPADPLEAVA